MRKQSFDEFVKEWKDFVPDVDRKFFNGGDDLHIQCHLFTESHPHADHVVVHWTVGSFRSPDQADDMR